MNVCEFWAHIFEANPENSEVKKQHEVRKNAKSGEFQLERYHEKEGRKLPQLREEERK